MVVFRPRRRECVVGVKTAHWRLMYSGRTCDADGRAGMTEGAQPAERTE